MDNSSVSTTDDSIPTDDLYLALGHVIFAFGQLDEALHDALWMAFDGNNDVRILTTGLRFPQLVEKFQSVYAGFQSDGSTACGVDEFCTHLNALNTDRNRQIHSTWGFWAETDRPVRSRFRFKRGSLSYQIESVHPKSLRDIANSMIVATGKVWEVALDYERQRHATKRSHSNAEGSIDDKATT